MFKIFILGLEKLRKKSSRRHSKLRKCCDLVTKNKKNTELPITDYVRPIFLGIDTQKNNLVIMSLELVENVVNLGFLKEPQTFEGKDLLAFTIDKVCNCFKTTPKKSVQEEKLQLQVVKTLLHLIISCKVKGKPLYKVVKTCFNIYLVTQNNKNVGNVAKASLTQIYQIVFKRLKKKGNHPNSIDSKTIPKTISTTVEEKDNNEKNEKKIIHKLVLDCISATENRLKGENDNLSAFNSPNTPQKPQKQTNRLVSQCEKDASFLLRALSRISRTKVILNPEEKKEPLSLKKVKLSLELIFIIFQNCRNFFKDNQLFILNIKPFLMESLIDNGFSEISEVFHLTMKIAFVLISYYGSTMKNEIKMFLTKIYYPMIESQNCDYGCMSKILKEFQRINQKAIIEIFTTFDCKYEEENLMERLIIQMMKNLEEGIDWYNSYEQKKIKKLSFFVLNNIVSSLINWKEIKPTQKEDTELITEKIRKSSLEKGINLFNKKPKKGIKSLIDSEIIEDDPISIALFIKSEKRIHKEKIGEYFGEKKNEAVLREHSKLFDYRDKDLIKCFRYYLNEFILPKEEAQISRCIEHFSNQYYANNQHRGVFLNADSTFFLVYSVLFLQTNQHNPNMKEEERIPFEDYKNLVKGKNGDSEYEESMVRSIYDDIKANKIEFFSEKDKLEEKKAIQSFKSLSLIPRKIALFRRESRILKSKLKKQKKRYKNEELLVPKGNIVKLFFSRSWSSFLKGIESFFERIENMNDLQIAINYMNNTIKIACLNQMHNASSSFISKLEQFTNMSKTPLVELNENNLEALKLLINLVYKEKLNLGSSWTNFLRCLSKIDYLKQGMFEKQNEEIYKKNAKRIFSRIDQSCTEIIFERTGKLNDAEIVHFIKSMVEVSSIDLHQWKTPRLFCLHKILLINHYNIARENYEELYVCMTEHCLAASLHKNSLVSMTGINQLKQLAIAVVEEYNKKNERTVVSFDFLKSFESVVALCDGLELKSLVVECLIQIGSKFHDILPETAWESFFKTVNAVTTKSNDIQIIERTFRDVQMFITKFFDDLKFKSLVNCLVSFAVNKLSEEIAEKAFSTLFNLSERIKIIKDDKELTSKWTDLIAEISSTISCSSLMARQKGIKFMENLITKYGEEFSTDVWKVLYSILFELLEKKTSSNSKIWLTQSFKNVYSLMIKMFKFHFFQKKSENASFFFKNLLDQSINLICPNRTICETINTSILELVEEMKSMSFEEWDIILEFYKEVLLKLNISEILKNPDVNAEDMKNKTHAQIEFMANMKKLIMKNFRDVQFSTLSKILEVLKNGVYAFSKKINETGRYSVNGAIDSKGNLLKLENNSIGLFFTILIKMFNEDKEEEGPTKESERKKRMKHANDYLFVEYKDFIKTYLQKTQIIPTKTEEQVYIHEINAIEPIMILILASLNSFSEEKLLKNYFSIYPDLCRLILSENKNIRMVLQTVFERIGKITQK